MSASRTPNAENRATLQALISELKRVKYDAETIQALGTEPVDNLLQAPDPPPRLAQRQEDLRRNQLPQQASLLEARLYLAGFLSVVLVLLQLPPRGDSAQPKNPSPDSVEAPPKAALSFTEMAMDTLPNPDREKGISARGYTERVLQSLSNFLILTSADGSIQMVNPAICDSLGVSQGELLGKPFQTVLHPEFKNLAEQTGDHEAVYLRKDGRSIPVLVSISAVPNPDGKVDGMVIVAQDISERQKTENALRDREQRLRNLTERLVTAQESERQRVARDLHDGMLQSVIAAELQLSSFLRRLQKKKIEVDQKPLTEGVECLRESVSQGRQLINDLRPPTLDKFGLVRSIKQEAEKLGRQAGCEVTVNCEGNWESLPHQLENALFRISQESFHNIRKHAKPGAVAVTLQRNESNVTLSVVDDGVGFDPRNTEKGVGSDSMRERAELLGGDFGLESRPGQGTSIRVSIPLGFDPE